MEQYILETKMVDIWLVAWKWNMLGVLKLGPVQVVPDLVLTEALGLSWFLVSWPSQTVAVKMQLSQIVTNLWSQSQWPIPFFFLKVKRNLLENLNSTKATYWKECPKRRKQQKQQEETPNAAIKRERHNLLRWTPSLAQASATSLADCLIWERLDSSQDPSLCLPHLAIS